MSGSDSDDAVVPSRRRWLLPLAVAASVLAVVVGAALVATHRDRSGEPDPVARTTNGPPTPTAAQLAKARALVARWDRTVGDAAYIPLRTPEGLGEPDVSGDYETQRLGSWRNAMGAERPYAMGLDQRRFIAAVDIPATQPADGVVRWDDGSTVPVKVRPAKDTFDRLLATATRCGNCPPDGTFDGVTPKPLTLTAVTATTMKVATTRGRATVRAWLFSFRETTMQMLQAAATATRVPPAPAGMSASMRIESASAGPDELTLTAHLVGMGGTSATPCGADYFAYPVESAHAVGVVVIERGYRSSTGDDRQACADMGYGRAATVHLAAPLGSRAVLEMSTGTAVPIVLQR